MSRGLLIFNPGNLRISSNPWHGKITPSRDSEFETFDCMENGIRAMARLLTGYFDNYKLHTITGIISRYAPSTENPTTAYIKAVSDSTGFDSDAFINLHDSAIMKELCSAMFKQEQGADAAKITQSQLDDGIARAYA